MSDPCRWMPSPQAPPALSFASREETPSTGMKASGGTGCRTRSPHSLLLCPSSEVGHKIHLAPLSWHLLPPLDFTPRPFLSISIAGGSRIPTRPRRHRRLPCQPPWRREEQCHCSAQDSLPPC